VKLAHWLRFTPSPRPKDNPTREPRRVQLGVHMLEDRVLPSGAPLTPIAVPPPSAQSAAFQSAAASLGAPVPLGPKGAIHDAAPTFSWGAVANADFYKVVVNDLTSHQMGAVRTTVTQTNLVPADPLVFGHHYQWKVRALNALGEAGSWSPLQTFTVKPLDTPIVVGPVGRASDTNLTLAWKPVALATAGYKYNLSDVTFGQAIPIEKGTVAGADGLLGGVNIAVGLSAGHRYQWKVQALSADGNRSAWSAPATFTAVRVNGLTAAAPSSILNVTISGVAFHPWAKATLLVRYPTGDTAKVVGVVLTKTGGTTSFSFAVPPFFDFTTSQVGAGAVDIRLKQPGVASVDLGSMLIESLPESDLPPGTLLSDFTTQSIQLVEDQIQNIQELGQKGGFDVSGHVAQLQNLLNLLTEDQAQLQSLLSGAITQIELGQLGGVPIVMDANALAFADRGLAAMFLNSGLGDAPAFGSLETLSGGGGAASFTTTDARQAVNNFFDRLRSKNVNDWATDIKRLSSVAGGVTGTIALLGVVGLAGPELVAAAEIAGWIGLGGKVAAIFAPVADQLIHNYLGTPAATEFDYDEFHKDLKELDADLFLKTALGAVGLIDAPKDALERISKVIDGALGLMDSIVDPEHSSSTTLVHYLDKKYTQIHDGLTRPVIGVEPGSMDFEQALGGAADDSQTLTVTNAGHGTLSYSITAPSWITVSGGGGELEADEFDEFDVTADAAGLLAGEYNGTITISDPNALNSPVSVPVHLSVETGSAAVSTSFISFTVEQGESPQRPFSVFNVGSPGTILHYTFFQSEAGRLSYFGTPTALPAGGRDDFTLVVNTANLAPRDNPYVYQFLVTNTDLPGDDPDRVKTITVSVKVNRPPAVINVNPPNLTLTYAAGTQPQDLQFTVANVGPSGSLLHWQILSSTNRASFSNLVDLAGGFQQGVTLHFNPTGLPAGNYSDTITIHSLDDPRVADVSIPFAIHVTSGQTTYRGSFSGFVQDDPSTESDPDDTFFRDNNYGGLATLTVTPGLAGGFDVLLDANANQSFGNNREETFSAGHFRLTWHVTQLTNLNFTFVVAMNDHCEMHGQGSFIGNTFQGTWSMVVTNPDDHSDSGAGSFLLFLQ